MKRRCPVCRKELKLSHGNQSEQAQVFPFCSKRCKLIDLGAWLDAEYKMNSSTVDFPDFTDGKCKDPNWRKKKSKPV